MHAKICNMIRSLSAKTPCERTVLAVGVVYIIVLASLNALCFFSTPLSALVASNLALLAFLYVVVRCIRVTCFKGTDDLTVVLRRFLALVVVSLGAGVVLEICTLIGDPTCGIWEYGRWSLRRIALFSCIAFCFVSFFLEYAPKIKLRLLQILEAIRGRLVHVALALVVFLCLSTGLGLVLCVCCMVAPFAAYVFSGCLVACALILAIAARRKIGISVMFSAAAITVGLCFAVICPSVVGLVWDDEIHYGNILRVSYLEEPSYTYSDDLMMFHGDHPESWILEGDADDVMRYTDILNSSINVSSVDMANRENDPSPNYILSSVQNIAYIPSAFGLWLGRLLHLPFNSVVVLGRLASLLFYVMICALSIRITPIKKTLLASVALLPTTIVLASNFTYDTWIISFVFLGTALLAKIICGSEKVRCIDLLPALVSFTMAIVVKPVYVPLVGLLALLDKGRFVDKRQQALYIGGIACAVILLVASFVVPFVLFGTGGNDMRGGSGVNSGMQVSYILENPIGYGVLLAKFIIGTYLNPLNSFEYTLQFGYMGSLGDDRFSFLAVLPLFVVIMVSMLDSNRLSTSLCTWKTRFVALLVFGVCVALVATSMYVAFTTVGSTSIAGVQGRYLLPIIFPFIAFFFNVKVENNMNEMIFNMLPICFFCFLGFLGCWLFAVSPVVV